MLFVGRIAQDAIVKQINEERQVVNFTVAVNHYYKPLGRTETVTETIYVNCSYWRNTKIAARLKKGAVVEVIGSVSVKPYLGADNEPKASTNFHVDLIILHHVAKQTAETAAAIPAVANLSTATDDLPF